MQLHLRKWALLPIELGELSAVALTHAHLDHGGCLPRLVKSDFCGSVRHGSDG